MAGAYKANEIVVDGRSRLDVYEDVLRVRASSPDAPVLVVTGGGADTLEPDCARIRWLCQVYRDLGCQVRFRPASADDLIPVQRPEKPAVSRRIGALIAVRTASTRLPAKALERIEGRESIALVIERLKACKSCEEVVVCTTTSQADDALEAIAAREQVAIYRGHVENVARRLADAAHEFGFDDFVRVTGDDPLRCIDLIDQAVESHRRQSADYTSMTGVFYGGDSEVVSLRALDAIVARAAKPENTEYLSWYLDDPTVFAQNAIAVDGRYWRDYRLTLDTPEDLQVFRALYAALYRPGQPVDAVEALQWLDANPQVAGINRSVRLAVKRSDMNLELNL